MKGIKEFGEGLMGCGCILILVPMMLMMCWFVWVLATS